MNLKGLKPGIIGGLGGENALSSSMSSNLQKGLGFRVLSLGFRV